MIELQNLLERVGVKNSHSPFLLQTTPGKLFWGTFVGIVLDGVWVNFFGAVDFCAGMDLNTGSNLGPYPLAPIHEECSRVQYSVRVGGDNCLYITIIHI